jgi:hypothetical protein
LRLGPKQTTFMYYRLIRVDPGEISEKTPEKYTSHALAKLLAGESLPESPPDIRLVASHHSLVRYVSIQVQY